MKTFLKGLLFSAGIFLFFSSVIAAFIALIFFFDLVGVILAIALAMSLALGMRLAYYE
jgi:hypothetical protein